MDIEEIIRKYNNLTQPENYKKETTNKKYFSDMNKTLKTLNSTYKQLDRITIEGSNVITKIYKIIKRKIRKENYDVKKELQSMLTDYLKNVDDILIKIHEDQKILDHEIKSLESKINEKIEAMKKVYHDHNILKNEYNKIRDNYNSDILNFKQQTKFYRIERAYINSKNELSSLHNQAIYFTSIYHLMQQRYIVNQTLYSILSNTKEELTHVVHGIVAAIGNLKTTEPLKALLKSQEFQNKIIDLEKLLIKLSNINVEALRSYNIQMKNNTMIAEDLTNVIKKNVKNYEMLNNATLNEQELEKLFGTENENIQENDLENTI